MTVGASSSALSEGHKEAEHEEVDLFSGQLEREAAISRRSLERVPTGRPDWKPHEKSMPLGYLSMLVATMPSWIAMAIQQDELDIGTGSKPTTWSEVRQLLDAHEDAVAQAGAALRGTSDDHLMTSVAPAGGRPDRDGGPAARGDRGHVHAPGPPSRPALRLPAPQRRGGAFDLRPDGRRADLRMSQAGSTHP